MKHWLLLGALLAAPLVAIRAFSGPGPWKAPLAEKTLANGLRVVVSRDTSAPTFGLCVTYGIGFRLEPKGRTGFAHLFEHMMFEGTPDAPKGVFDRIIEEGGGANNADTRFDFTEYYETAPISALAPVMWLEADRMKGLAFSQKTLDNQRNVVQEEVRVNVLNQPYGSFYWLDLPQKAFDKYPNAHNFYGDFKDLDAATLADAKEFFHRYYAPNNAVLSVVGDVEPQQVFAEAEKHFGSIPRRTVPPRPDISEAPQTAQRKFTETDKLARVPALAVGYRMPRHGTPDAITGAVVGEILHNGQASRLYQALVKDKKVALEVYGGANWPLGSPYAYDGPSLMTSFILYPPNSSEQQVLSAYDAVIHSLATQGCTSAELNRVLTKMRSDWYSQLEMPMTRASMIGQITLFSGSPQRVNEIPEEISQVTPERVRSFAGKYLVRTNRTIIDRVPGSSAPAKPSKEGAKQ